MSFRNHARYGLGLILIVTAVANSEAADQWACLRTDNLEIVGHMQQDVARNIATQLEQFRQLLSRALGARPVRSAAVRVYLFETDRHFRPFKPLKDAKPAPLSGFFRRDFDRDTMALEVENSLREVSQYAFHLYAHVLIGSLADRWPLWLTEGLAEFFSTADFGDDKVHLGEPPKRHVTFFRENQSLTLTELFGASRNSSGLSCHQLSIVMRVQLRWFLPRLMVGDRLSAKARYICYFFGVFSI